MLDLTKNPPRKGTEMLNYIWIAEMVSAITFTLTFCTVTLVKALRAEAVSN